MCGLPTWLDITIEPLEGVSLRVTLQGRALAYATWTGDNAPTTTFIHPSPQQWRKFLSALEEIKLWNWEAEYAAEGSDAGMRWSIEIVAPGRLINTAGIGAFPPGEAFPRFRAALHQLLDEGDCH